MNGPLPNRLDFNRLEIGFCLIESLIISIQTPSPLGPYYSRLATRLL